MTAFAYPVVARPIIGESALSFASRLADLNGFLLLTVLRDIGDLRAFDNWQDRHWDRLARRSLTPLQAIEPFRRRPAEITTAPTAVRFLGKAVHPNYLVTSRLRICPTCVGERRMLKDIWRLVHCVACADHRTRLIDSCACGRPFEVRTRGIDPFQCACGRDFADNPVQAATEGAILGAEWLIQAFGANATATPLRLWLVKGGRLSLPFSAMEPYDVMLVIDMIGQAATVPASEDAAVTPGRRWAKGTTPERDLATRSAQVEAAMRVLHRWPEAYQDLLARVAGRNQSAGASRPNDLFATRIGQFMLTPYRGIDGQPLKALQEEVDAFLVTRGLKIRQKVPMRTSTTARDIQKIMPCSKVARALGLRPSNSILKRVYRETVEAFDTSRDGGEDPATLGRKVLLEVKRRLATADDFMSPSATSEYLCHPNIATYSAMWVHPDLLTPVEPDRSVVPLMKGDAFLRTDVERMRKRIEDAASLMPTDGIPAGYDPYNHASKVGVDATYTGTDLLLDMLSGAVPIIRTGETPRLTDLFVHTPTARRRSIEKRVSKIIGKDQFAGTSWVEHILSMLWPNRPERLTIEINRQLRADGSVRFETKLNTTEGRTRPLYWYSLVDHMMRALREHGPSVSADVDRQLNEVRQSNDLPRTIGG